MSIVSPKAEVLKKVSQVPIEKVFHEDTGH
jgi:hypothetical protein